MQKIAEICAHYERMPLKEPFETAKRRAKESETVFVELKTDRGIIGLGAATPVQYVTGETVESVTASIGEAEAKLVGRPVRAFASLAGILMDTLPEASSARAAIEMAIVDAAGKEAGEPSYVMLGGRARTVETDITIPVVPAAHAAELARAAAARGFRIFKVKAGGKDSAEDIARALAIVEAAPGSSLVVDANQGFQPQQAVDFMRDLVSSGASVELFEQPVDAEDIDGLAYVTRELDVPVFADESARKPCDVARLARHHAVSGVNVKLMKSGVFGALEIASICAKTGLDLMLGCMIEPRVAIAAALHVACAAEGFRHFDLDADMLLLEEGSGWFARSGPMLTPFAAPGLGCA